MAWAPAYASTAELKSFVSIGDTADDTQLALAAEAASRAVDLYTNRQFGAITGTEEWSYTAEWDRRRGRWLIDIDDLMTTDDLTVTVVNAEGDDVGDIDLYELEPVNAVSRDSKPWTRIVVRPDAAYKPTSLRNGVQVTATWGWSAVPDAVKQATLLQASRIFARRTSPYGVAGSPELGSELRLQARLDPDVAVVLAPYRRWWAGA
jgi:hypothetical protein